MADVNWTPPDMSSLIGAALRAGGEALEKASNELAPKDKGDLVESSFVEVEGEAARIGYTAEYALKQHEALGLKHPNGGSAKFLELASIREAGAIGEAMADVIRQQMGRP
jgi:hypothetical protein